GELTIVVPAARCRHLGGGSLDRRSRRAQRHAVSGHLRVVGGGWRTPVVLGLAVGQVLREGGGVDRLQGVAEGWADWRRRGLRCPDRCVLDVRTRSPLRP
ncbi:MAG: hypothetical protein D6798_18930, partial [Deltaproteobacteria bacterium]